MQDPSYLGKIALVSIGFKMVLTQITPRVYKDSFTLTYPPNINGWPELQFSIRYPGVDSLISFLKLLIDALAFTSIFTRPTLVSPYTNLDFDMFNQLHLEWRSHEIASTGLPVLVGFHQDTKCLHVVDQLHLGVISTQKSKFYCFALDLYTLMCLISRSLCMIDTRITGRPLARL